MIPLYTEEEYKNSKSMDRLPCQCEHCNKTFLKLKKHINENLSGKRNTSKYCSNKCQISSKITKQKVICLHCLKEFEKIPAEIKSSPNHFCSRSCATFNRNKNKLIGTRRSKLELYLEEQLTSLYPTIEMHYNRKDTINSELDIYIPSLKLAFELNGIFHYEPIYGSDKLNQIQNNDNRKFQACLEQGIELGIIDTTGLKYFKLTNAQKYLDIIVNIINQRTFVLTS